MTTPTTNITFSSVQTEFGGANPISFSEYYRGSGTGYVPSGQATSGTDGTAVSAAGAIRLGMFRGLSKVSAISLTISANTTNYNIFTAAGSTSAVVNVTVTINPGVYVYGSSTGNYGMTTGTGWNASSTITVVNNGVIAGFGGAGGAGGTSGGGGAGAAGGPAFRAERVVTIQNNGTIAGGGGGGGGGGGLQSSSGKSIVYYSGGGGGGGRVLGNGGAGGSGGSGNGAAGGAGSTTAAGAGGAGSSGAGAGGAGGNFAAGAVGASATYAAGAGGAQGAATSGAANGLSYSAIGTRLGTLG